MKLIHLEKYVYLLLITGFAYSAEIVASHPPTQLTIYDHITSFEGPFSHLNGNIIKETSLTTACENNDIEKAKWLCNMFPNLVNVHKGDLIRKDPMTGVMKLVKQSENKKAAALLKEHYKESPVKIATLKNNSEMIQGLKNTLEIGRWERFPVEDKTSKK